MKITDQQYEVVASRSKAGAREIPADQPSSVAFGILVHLGPIIIPCLILAFIDFTLFNVILVTMGFSFLGLGVSLWAARRDPAVDLPPMPVKVLLRAFLWDITGKGFGVGLTILFGTYYLLSFISPYAETTAPWYKILAAVALSDLWYYCIHRWFMHSKGRGSVKKALRKEHSVHHSITDLDFFRGNKGSLIDNGVISFAFPLAMIGTVLGLSLPGLALAYIILMSIQITHHVNHSFQIGWLKYIIFDSHAHKMHHCKRGRLVNFAAVFAIWDRLLGTYYEDFDLSPSYMHAHNITLPINPVKGK